MREDPQNLIQYGEIPSGPAPVFTFNSLIFSKIAFLVIIEELKSIELVNQLLLSLD